MLATLGIIVTEEFHPIFDAHGDAKFVSAALSHYSPTLSANFWPAFWTTFGALDLYLDLVVKQKDSIAGDFGFDP